MIQQSWKPTGLNPEPGGRFSRLSCAAAQNRRAPPALRRSLSCTTLPHTGASFYFLSLFTLILQTEPCQPRLPPTFASCCGLVQKQRGSDGKEPASNAGDTSWIPGSRRSPGEGSGSPRQCSCLENPTDRGAWRATKGDEVRAPQGGTLSPGRSSSSEEAFLPTSLPPRFPPASGR